MQQFIDFVLQYWKLFILIVLSVVEFLLFLFFKKRPVCFYAGVFEHLVPLIIEAEFKFPGSGRGKEKKDFVLSQFYEEYPDMKTFSYIDISSTIEYLLSLPAKKKKGGN